MPEASFPTSPAFNEQFIPAPPTWVKEEMTSDDYLEKLSNFMGGQYLGLRNLQNSIASGWLISTLRVLDLTADTITSGSIFTQDLYIGTDGDGGIRLGGTDNQIEITDDSGTTRVLAGDIGSGNWFQVSNSSGTVILQSGTTTFIDGVILKNASVADGAITDLAGNKLTGSGFIDTTQIANAAVTNAKIDSLSADKITVSGTLTCTSSTTAIEVTSSGVMTFSSGGDIIMRASGTGDDSLIQLETSGEANRGNFGYNSTTDRTFLQATNGADLLINVVGGGAVVFGFQDIVPATDGGVDLGTNSLKWGTVYRDAEGDIPMRNAFVITEPDLVYKDADRDSGLCFMQRTTHIENKDWEWEQVAFLDREGYLHCRGIKQVEGFAKPDYPYRGNLELSNSFHNTNIRDMKV